MAPARSATTENPFWASIFSGSAGLFIAVALLKWGNPVIFENQSTTPADVWELVFQPWPFFWGYWLITILVVVGLKTASWKIPAHRTVLVGLLLPLVWLGWQFLSATQTVDSSLTRSTIKHFAACCICFYLGWFALGEVRNFRWLLVGILSGFGCVLIVGWQQHFGGLEQTRRFFYELPNWRDFPPEFIKKVSSNRIYSTLFYPNTLAAAILLMLPVSLAGFWAITPRLSRSARITGIVFLLIGALGCLIWSGSKSGWLLFLLLCLVVLFQIHFSPFLKKWLVLGLLIVGLGGFAVKYANFFQRGATSVVARFDYWNIAGQIVKQNPVLGTGPGTFFISYQKLKKPESEMARLCHNDYLQQGSDSGIIGMLSFGTFIVLSLVFCRPNLDFQRPMVFSVWLGLVGISLHSMVEFNLYIPAIAWPSFLFFGWLWGLRAKEIFDKTASAS